MVPEQEPQDLRLRDPEVMTSAEQNVHAAEMRILTLNDTCSKLDADIKQRTESLRVQRDEQDAVSSSLFCHVLLKLGWHCVG